MMRSHKKTSVLMFLALVVPFFGTAYASQGDTWYRMENGQNKKNIANQGSRNAGAVMVANSSVSVGGHWKLEVLGNGKYRIRNRHSGMYMANFGQPLPESPIKQTGTPGAGAEWKLNKLQGGYYQIVNGHSGMYLGLGGQQDGARIVQTDRSSGMTTWRFVPVQSAPASSNTGSTGTAAAAPAWQQISAIPSKYHGVWKIFSRMSKRNDVTISRTNIMSGRVDMKILKVYHRDGVYKVITTLNNYYQTHFFKDRSGGYTGKDKKGIYINSTNRQAFRTFQEADALALPSKLDEGYRG